MYDKERIERIVSAKRNAFYKRIGAIGFLMLTLLVIALINAKDSLSFICLAAELPMMLLFGRV